MDMVQPFTERDVKLSMFSIDRNKSPCPDGYGSSFIKEAWIVIGHEVTSFVVDFFNNGKLLR